MENEIKKYWIQGVGSDCYPWELVKNLIENKVKKIA